MLLGSMLFVRPSSPDRRLVLLLVSFRSSYSINLAGSHICLESPSGPRRRGFQASIDGLGGGGNVEGSRLWLHPRLTFKKGRYQ